ncbi:MAG: hypothetical protein MRY83_22025 [Flavobacteriales bacterium]|nr:hypothetical protein [Flavobacteriales bacterium]
MKQMIFSLFLVLTLNINAQEEQPDYKSHRIMGVLGFPAALGIQYEYSFLENDWIRMKTSCEIRRRHVIDLFRDEFSNEIGFLLQYQFKPFKSTEIPGVEFNFGFFTHIGKSPIEYGTLLDGTTVANQYIAPQFNIQLTYELPSNLIFKTGVGYPNALNLSVGKRF